MTHQEAVELQNKAYKVANALVQIPALVRENAQLKALLWRVMKAQSADGICPIYEGQVPDDIGYTLSVIDGKRVAKIWDNNL